MGKKILWFGVAVASYYLIRKKLKEQDSTIAECLKKGLDKIGCMLEKMGSNSSHSNSSSSETMRHTTSPIQDQDSSQS